MKSWKCSTYFTLTACLDLYSSHFQCSVPACGQWLPIRQHSPGCLDVLVEILHQHYSASFLLQGILTHFFNLRRNKWLWGSFLPACSMRPSLEGEEVPACSLRPEGLTVLFSSVGSSPNGRIIKRSTLCWASQMSENGPMKMRICFPLITDTIYSTEIKLNTENPVRAVVLKWVWFCPQGICQFLDVVLMVTAGVGRGYLRARDAPTNLGCTERLPLRWVNYLTQISVAEHWEKIFPVFSFHYSLHSFYREYNMFSFKFGEFPHYFI